MALRIAALTLIKVVSSTITLDDMDTSVTTNSFKMDAAGLEQCKVDAHAGNFHHDGGVNKADASFEFKFQVSQSGCYLLEEYHPGKAGNSNCSQLLTTNAQLDVDWCKGRDSVITLDQSRHGGQWNFVGIFPFFVGHPGAIRITNPAGSVGRHLVVDAFRFTRVASRCTNALQHKLWLESGARTVSVVHQHAPMWQEGELHLTVRPNLAAGTIDLLASLKTHSATIQATLRSHLMARSLILKEISMMEGRRLGGCRRLEAAADSVDFKVRFVAEVTASMAVSDAAFSSELNTDLVAKGAEFTIESAELALQPTATAKEADPSTTSYLPFVLTGIFGLILVAALATLSVRCKRVAPSDVAQKELEEGQNEKPQEKTEELPVAAKTVEENFDDSTSTATPDSDNLKDIETMSTE